MYYTYYIILRIILYYVLPDPGYTRHLLATLALVALVGRSLGLRREPRREWLERGGGEGGGPIG